MPLLLFFKYWYPFFQYKYFLNVNFDFFSPYNLHLLSKSKYKNIYLFLRLFKFQWYWIKKYIYISVQYFEKLFSRNPFMIFFLFCQCLLRYFLCFSTLSEKFSLLCMFQETSTFSTVRRWYFDLITQSC